VKRKHTTGAAEWPQPKEQELGNDTHGSKIIVVPFDGIALDRDLQKDSR
jgi:hypothetical protein